ncbi:MAG: class I SAM-dependent methyltransferase [Nostocaceae cyanobacterium]|nr:class I SAM-dependent methyltransferase [Nostocaceae cyanobacterium]
MSLKLQPKNDQRSFEQIEEHYKLEKELAHKLLNSSKQERQHLYTDLYNELYTTIIHHPRWTRKSSPEISAWIVAKRMEILSHYVSPEKTYLEIGPGDCTLAVEVSKHAKQVYAVDVATEVTKNQVFPSNFEFRVSDGCSIPVTENSIDIAYSHQLMEHLHPDDALEQLENIYKALAPKGKYICITPNGLSGPHDISQYFDNTATGFHLKEYTVTELYQLFRQVGFSRVSWLKNNGKYRIDIPLNLFTILPIKITEIILSQLPYTWRHKIANLPMLFRGMTIIGTK